MRRRLDMLRSAVRQLVLPLLTVPGLYDTLAAVGLLLVAAGLWGIWPPVCLIVLGILLMALALRGAMAAGEERQSRRRHRRPREWMDARLHEDERGEEAMLPCPAIEKGHLVTEGEDDQ